jgi:hypothetical protein
LRVICLTTGRSGSSTLAAALGHATNFTVGHETRSSESILKRVAFPDGHIEVDNRLAWFVGHLADLFGESSEVVWVYLSRDPALVAKSYSTRIHSTGIVRAYARGIRKDSSDLTHVDWYNLSLEMVEVINRNIELLLSSVKGPVIRIAIESPERGFTDLWKTAAIEGDLNAALKELRVNHNSSENLRRRARMKKLHSKERSR